MRRLALAAASTVVIGCGLTDVGGLGGSNPLGDSEVVDSGLDATRVDTGTIPDAVDETEAETDGDATLEADADAGCPVLAETDACKALPALLVEQTVDGDPIDFVCIPTTTFDLGTAAATDPKPPPPLPEVVKMRAAWTATGLAIHVHVVDPSIVVAPTSDPNLFDADAVEVFVSGTTPLTGTFDGVSDPNAMQLIVTPAYGGAPARAKIYQSGEKGPLDPALFATKLTVDGYDVELAIPWTLIGGIGGMGAKVALDVAIDVDDDTSTAPARAVWAVWQQKSVAGKSACAGTTTSWAWCDDRSWCTPSLE